MVTVFCSLRFLSLLPRNMLKSPAADRNKEPIAQILRNYLRDGQKVFEIGSGTGQHISYFGKCFPTITFQPSEVDARMLHSIVGYVDAIDPENVRVPLFIDAGKSFSQWGMPEDFSPGDVDVILSINMIHICSRGAINGLFEAADVLLKKDQGLLITYGPYSIDGILSPQSNIDFDEELKRQNPEYGVKDVKFMEEKYRTPSPLIHWNYNVFRCQRANEVKMRLIARHEMPANNKILVFKK